jgi:hypothetical protein
VEPARIKEHIMSKFQFRFLDRRTYAALFVVSLLTSFSGFGLISAGFDGAARPANFGGQIDEVVVVG